MTSCHLLLTSLLQKQKMNATKIPCNKNQYNTASNIDQYSIELEILERHSHNPQPLTVGLFKILKYELI